MCEHVKSDDYPCFHVMFSFAFLASFGRLFLCVDLYIFSRSFDLVYKQRSTILPSIDMKEMGNKFLHQTQKINTK